MFSGLDLINDIIFLNTFIQTVKSKVINNFEQQQSNVIGR